MYAQKNDSDRSRVCLLLLVKTLVNECSDDSHLGISQGKVLDSLRVGKDIEEENTLLRHAVALQSLNSKRSRTTCKLERKERDINEMAPRSISDSKA